MKILWFFLIIGWNGDVAVRHHYSSLERCDDKRNEAVAQYRQTVRAITQCVGVPMDDVREEPFG